MADHKYYLKVEHDELVVLLRCVMACTPMEEFTADAVKQTIEQQRVATQAVVDLGPYATTDLLNKMVELHISMHHQGECKETKVS